MAPLESRIDDLYKGLPGDFIRERAALAKSVKGADAQRVKGLPKPLLVPWAINQVYWHARPVYERLEQAGEKLRSAQVAALSGRKVDVPGATRAHRDAVAAAVAEGMRLASAAGTSPSADQLTRTFEALSLASKQPETPGRLTKPLAPAGFEALGGVAVKATAPPPPRIVPSIVRPADTKESRLAEKARERQSDLARRKDAALRKSQAAALKNAEAEVARARSAEALARKKWEQAKQRLDSTDRALRALRGD